MLRTALFSLALVGAARADPDSDAAAACAALNISEQISMMFGVGEIDGYSRNSGCAGVCQRRTFRWDNGPQGFGDGCPPGSSTQWSSSLAAAATFDGDLVYRWGVAMGEEWFAKGTNIFEGPGVNVARIQKNGRNFEYMSGASEALGAYLLPRLIAGVQLNAMAVTKHYIGALGRPCAPAPPNSPL